MTLGDSASKVLREAMGERASPMLTERLCTSLQRCGDDPSEILRTLEKVRTSLRLFVDESVADSVDSQLRVAVRLAPRARRT